MRQLLAVANWKMNFTVTDALKFIMNFQKEMPAPPENVTTVFVPSAVSLYPVMAAVGETLCKVGAQNIFWEETGSFTGEISAKELKDLEVEYVLIGHSERRHVFGETDAQIEKKLAAALGANLKPILCVGETDEERNQKKTFGILENQLRVALGDKRSHQIEDLIIAYEPVWAIGTGKTATPSQAQEIHQWIRDLLTQLYDGPTAKRTPILYGGSVDPEKATGLMAQTDIDGVLVGGASLDPKKFADIVHVVSLKESL